MNFCAASASSRFLEQCQRQQMKFTEHNNIQPLILALKPNSLKVVIRHLARNLKCANTENELPVPGKRENCHNQGLKVIEHEEKFCQRPFFLRLKLIGLLVRELWLVFLWRLGHGKGQGRTKTATKPSRLNIRHNAI